MWKWAAASLRGSSHEKTQTPLQDAFTCFNLGTEGQYFVGVVSDGAGSASHGRQGANLICRTMGTLARRHIKIEERLPTDNEILRWTDDVRDRLAAVALARNLPMREFAGTLVCFLSNGMESVIAHVGDGCAVLREHGSDSWIAATWPAQGEYASTTFFMTDDVEIRLRITRHLGEIGSIALFSDGIERLALDFSSKEPHARFFNPIFAPVAASECIGRDQGLSTALKAYLGSPGVLARTDDDKTLILAVRK